MLKKLSCLWLLLIPVLTIQQPFAQKQYHEMVVAGKGNARSLAWSPDSTMLAAGGSWGIRLYTPSLGLLREFDDSVAATAVAWSPDGQRLASAGVDNTIKIWDVTTGNISAVLSGHMDRIPDLDWSSDGTKLASASLDNTVKIWDIRQGALLMTLPHENEVWSVSWRPNSNQVASGSGKRYSDISAVKVWDAESGTLLSTYTNPAIVCDAVIDLAWNPEGTVLAGADCAATLWDGSTGNILTDFPYHSTTVTSVEWNAAGTQIASCSMSTVWIWDVETQNIEVSLKDLPPDVEITSMRWSSDGNYIATLDKRGTLRISDAQTGDQLFDIKDFANEIDDVVWNSSQNWIAASNLEFGFVSILDSTSGVIERTLDCRKTVVYTVAWSPDNTQLLAGFSSRLLTWDTLTGEEVADFGIQMSLVYTAEWSPDGKYVTSAGYDSSVVNIWDATTGGLLFTLTPAEVSTNDTVYEVTWSPDSSRIASATQSGMVWVFDVATGETIRRFDRHSSPVKSVDWSPDGDRIASAGEDGTIFVWDVTTGDVVLQLGHSGIGVNTVVWSPDGRQLASGSNDRLIQIWDAQTGELLATLAGHTDDILSLDWSPDGTQLVSGSRDGTVRIWGK